MDLKNLQLDLDGPVGVIRLNRPGSLNSLSLETLDELITVAAECNDRSHLRVVIIAGAGDSFCAGAELGSIAALFDESMERAALERVADSGRRMADAIESIRAVTIASIHGHCIGGGVVLAAACDLRIAASDVRFAIPEAAIGIPLGWGGVPRLVRIVGPAVATELILTCRPFDAEEALRFGFLNRVVPARALESAVRDLAETIASKSPYVVEQTKRAVLAATDEIVSTRDSHADDAVMLGALGDEESRRLAQAYLSGFTKARSGDPG
jgi:enoyl-CoA hydratase/carnithine racemase